MSTNRPSVTTARTYVWLASVYLAGADVVRRLWAHCRDESGVEDSPSKLIYLAVAVAVAIAAGVFIIGVFNDAQSGVPDPVAPAP